MNKSKMGNTTEKICRSEILQDNESVVKKLIQFGAGNIGRSFIGQIFSKMGYEIIFADINEQLIRIINKKKSYRVIIKDSNKPDYVIQVKNIRAINLSEQTALDNELKSVSLAAISVGKNALPHLIPVIARALQKRWASGNKKPLDILIAENIRNGAEFIKNLFFNCLDSSYHSSFTETIGLIATSIGKMVPLMTETEKKTDPLQVFAEPYNTLIVDTKGFKNTPPRDNAICAVENIRAYVDRKLFIHNLGHSATAYLGYQYCQSLTYIYEALQIREIFQKVKKCMKQAALALHKEYPVDLSLPSLYTHIDDLLFRFQNKALGDTIFRVGKDVRRKLGKDDRLLGALLLTIKHSTPNNAIVSAIRAAACFLKGDEHGVLSADEKQFYEMILKQNFAYTLLAASRLNCQNSLEQKALTLISECTI
ncbi:MAG TPA: mannitol-1-phosphate 5-dehydrogenase [Spirochaetia bacterium]|nr:mannitol-1-phosphate 5-dehydrogenase [Spirochaetia bacterium]